MLYIYITLRTWMTPLPSMSCFLSRSFSRVPPGSPRITRTTYHTHTHTHTHTHKPGPYIALRLKPTILKYQQQIPSLAHWRFMLQCAMFVCTGTSAALAYFSHPSYVAIVSATSTAIGSWIAFQSLETQLTRYSSTVRALKGQLSWWYSLSDVDQVSVVQITRLVHTCENTITAEQMAWQITNKEPTHIDKSHTTASTGEASTSGGNPLQQGTPSQQTSLSKREVS